MRLVLLHHDLDGDMRISVGSKGSVFVHVKDADGDDEGGAAVGLCSLNQVDP
jgi:hypothetical protein